MNRLLSLIIKLNFIASALCAGGAKQALRVENSTTDRLFSLII